MCPWPVSYTHLDVYNRQVHDESLLQAVLDSNFEGRRRLDQDTLICPQSGAAALRAAGAAVAGVDSVMKGETSTVFCACLLYTSRCV